MRSLLVFLATVCMIDYVFACTSSGWSGWINDYTSSFVLFPEEIKDNITIGGGDKENMNRTERNAFCTPGRGVITNIECATVNGTNYLAQGSKGMRCRVDKGFECQNRLVTGGTCLDYKIRFFCNCTDPSQTTTRGLAGSATNRPHGGIDGSTTVSAISGGGKDGHGTGGKTDTSDSGTSGSGGHAGGNPSGSGSGTGESGGHAGGDPSGSGADLQTTTEHNAATTNGIWRMAALLVFVSHVVVW